jgi:hypothetical protein
MYALAADRSSPHGACACYLFHGSSWSGGRFACPGADAVVGFAAFGSIVRVEVAPPDIRFQRRTWVVRPLCHGQLCVQQPSSLAQLFC